MKRVAILLFFVASGLYGQEAPTITIRKGETTNVALQNLGGSESRLDRCSKMTSISRDGLA
jgi:hypothetical protein